MTSNFLLRLTRNSDNVGDGVDYFYRNSGRCVGGCWLENHFRSSDLDKIGVLRNDYTFVTNYKLRWEGSCERSLLFITYEDGREERE